MLQHYETEREYTRAIENMQERVIKEYREIAKEQKSDESMLKSLEAKIGSKADEFANIKSQKYLSVVDYRDAWFNGLINSHNDELKMVVKNDLLREYVVLYVERSYIKNSKQYKKIKVEDVDRELYLGNNNRIVGIFVQPRKESLTNYEWKSAPLKGLKVKYTYLTLGQLKEDGYLVGTIKNGKYEANLVRVENWNDIVAFYEEFKKEGSVIEKKFIERYMRYVEEQDDWREVPMLLPEVRWGKDKVYHKYRADYLIANYYTGDRIAIELSPDSTHLIHCDIKEDWKRENDKRNSYFFKYKVPTITYTNEYLSDIDMCFERISHILERPQKRLSYEDIISAL